MFFATQSKLLIGGVMLFAVLFIVGSYFDTHWYYGEVPIVPAHLLAVGPYRPKANQEAPVSASLDTESPESLSVPDAEELSGDDVVSTTLPDRTEDELSAFLQDSDLLPVEKGDFPEVPEGFPSDLAPVWIEYPNYQKGYMYNQEMIDRVLIKLWSQGDHDFLDGVYRDGKVYPIYRDVMYVEWSDEIIEGPDGEIEFRFIRSFLGTHVRGSPKIDVVGGLFTVEEMISEAYKTKYPGLKLVDYEDGGYNPETFLDDD